MAREGRWRKVLVELSIAMHGLFNPGTIFVFSGPGRCHVLEVVVSIRNESGASQ